MALADRLKEKSPTADNRILLANALEVQGRAERDRDERRRAFGRAIALLGALVGVLLAVVGLRALTLAPTARGFISPNLPPQVLLIALAMAVGLSLLGGLYPAARAATLEPTEALRYE